ncbi:hypothetical protein M011DRAFT_486515 [Sporormia fimetaria CBS 119925]|uniref:CBF1-interacting co-repressor CIR N-terminal domain-containing protein n=1 Tax=Sporormia fimetaria CBS 119925 TaxID=1340428 RepID=A0A6A6V9B3_9PLEO|nr:hypothetical protein M011DRAFT_486515 [Sporormia fimetaria CBS 119925]
MGGDLNTKKSWHPAIRRNQERVWESEKAALEERKQIEKLRKEREEERDLENLRKLQEAAGGKTVQKRVDWMYSGPGGDGAGVTEEREGYLLGKRRIDHLLKADDSVTQSLSKGAAAAIDTVGAGTAGTARDITSKIAQDPLLAIQKQKMEMQLKMMRDAKKEAEREAKRQKEKEREKKHKHRHSRRERSTSRHRHRSRDRHQSRSPRRRHHNSRRDSRSPSRDGHRSRSRSPYQKSYDRDTDRGHRRDRHRSRSPRRDTKDDRHSYRARSPRRDRQDRSLSPERRRSRSPYKYQRNDRRNGRDGGHFYRRRSPPPVKQEEKDTTDDVAGKLARMQADANDLEKQRNERVRLRELEDAAEEESRRQKMGIKGGAQRLTSGMRLEAAERRREARAKDEGDDE